VYEDKLFVADAKGSQVAVFNKKSGKLLYKIGKSADESTDEPDNETIRFAAPTNIAVDTEGNIYVSETMGYRIIKLTEDGKHLFTFGAGLGDGFGQFARPRGVAVDHEGRVYSVDAWHSVVQIFNAQGQLLLFFGTIGNQPGNLNLPAQVTIDYDNVPYFKKYVAPGFDLEYLIIVTSQYGNRKINIFGFVHKNGEGDV
jgi:DNA-binding beta-propeller fold protein YncE